MLSFRNEAGPKVLSEFISGETEMKSLHLDCASFWLESISKDKQGDVASELMISVLFAYL